MTEYTDEEIQVLIDTLKAIQQQDQWLINVLESGQSISGYAPNGYYAQLALEKVAKMQRERKAKS